MNVCCSLDGSSNTDTDVGSQEYKTHFRSLARSQHVVESTHGDE